MKLNPLLVLFGVALSGCSGSPPTKISERFDLCATLPPNASYTLTTRGPDYEMGRLDVRNDVIEVYSGYQPDFPRRVAKTISQVSGHFQLADTARTGPTQKVLLWRKRTPDDAPLLVVLEGRDVLAALPSIQHPGVVASCP
ncbi:hypothetical protein RDV84_23820 [Lysobacter yananisis]|uniref:Uncharacterized protein n=1 Tax=Lysobacter yananisis TaxID=1003114 RepID=A0ABY9P7Q4_9GAMM|nr:hypothetical protein [Lysobacter yananisis]WMT02954.1 hypothetical protein RDV84_23820 [Lysobacter yananisis]